MGTIYSKPAVGPAWGETANNPADLVTMAPSDVSVGWPLSSTPPSRQRFNYILNWLATGVRYAIQRGATDWDAAETYAANALVIDPATGNIYKSNPNTNTGPPNINKPPSTTPSYWSQVGWTAAQINALGLTQANIASGDNSTKVANTNFVQSAITSLFNTLTTNMNTLNSAMFTYVNQQITIVDNAIAACNAAITAAIATATNNAVAQISPGLSVNISANGWIKLPNWASNLMIQWGTTGVLPDGGGGAATGFPTPFPNACFTVVASNTFAAGGSRIISVVGWSSTAFTLQSDGSNGTATWIAIGH